MGTIENNLENALYNLYDILLKDVNPYRSKLTDLYPFIAQWGKNYQPNEGILFVGRATNGWVSTSDNVNILFGKSPQTTATYYQAITNKKNELIFNRKDQMEWINKKTNAFFLLLLAVCELYHTSRDATYAAWSNIAKIAPEKSNPNKKLFGLQNNMCHAILKEEINILSPKYVIFITKGRVNWWSSFLTEFLGPIYYNPPLDMEKWSSKNCKEYIVDYYEINNQKYLITERPEGKSIWEHANAINEIIKRH